eukprot:447285-Hanusia_phi.AAC.1
MTSDCSECWKLKQGLRPVFRDALLPSPGGIDECLGRPESSEHDEGSSPRPALEGTRFCLRVGD